MFREQLTGFLNAVGDAAGEIALTEMIAHCLGQLPPEFISATDMDGLIANHGKFAGARSDKNQDPVSFRGLVEAQAGEFFLRGGDGILDMCWTDEQPDLTGSPGFGFANGGDDFGVPQFFGKRPGIHGF